MKKIISVILSIALLLGMSLNSYADTSNPSPYDRAEEAGVLDELRAKGLTEMNVKSLATMGFTFEEQAQLDIGTIKEFLGDTYGKTSVPQPRATYIDVTNVPDDIYGKGTETFLSGCGFVAGDFYTNNNGSTVVSQINAFAAKVFKGASSKKYYYLYGEYDPNYGVHKGVDLQAANGTAIFSAHEGMLKQNKTYGLACIQNSSWTNTYAHMRNLKSEGPVSVGQQIGNQSNVAPFAINSHLHFEVRSGQVTSLAATNESFSTSRNPYFYMVTPIR